MQLTRTPPARYNPNVLRLDGRARKFVRASQPLIVTLTSVFKNLVAVPANMVYVIDSVHARFKGRATAAAANDTLTLRITDIAADVLDMPINIPGTATESGTFVIDWRPERSMVIGPGMTLQGRVSNNTVDPDFVVTLNILGFMMTREEARSYSLAPTAWNGSSYTSSGFMGGVRPANNARTALIPGVAGKSIQVEFIHVSLFANNAAADNPAFLSFYDGTTEYKLMQWYSRSTALNTRKWLTYQGGGMELNGPISADPANPFGLFFTSPIANVASVLVAGRYVNNHNTYDPTGVHVGPLNPGVNRYAGLATAGAAGTLTDGGAAWQTNQWAGWYLNLVGGTGAGQRLVVKSNTGTVLTVQGTFSPAPDATTRYLVYREQGARKWWKFYTAAAATGGGDSQVFATQALPGFPGPSMIAHVTGASLAASITAGAVGMTFGVTPSVAAGPENAVGPTAYTDRDDAAAINGYDAVALLNDANQSLYFEQGSAACTGVVAMTGWGILRPATELVYTTGGSGGIGALYTGF
jgi:hypothetical protein